MSNNGRISILFLLNGVLYLLLGQLNTVISGFSLYLHADALYIIFFGLFLNRFSGLFYSALLGLLVDAMNPAPNGSFALAYIGLWLFFVWCQRRIRRQNPLHIRTVAILGQFFLLSAVTLIMIGKSGAHAVYWPRLLIDMAFSLVFVFLTASPWCFFQKTLLDSLGWNIEAQLSRP